MIITTDICPKTGLKREIHFIKSIDDLINKVWKIDCLISYYNPITNEYLGDNFLSKDNILITIDNINTLDGIGEYDYWKGQLNDFNGLISKGINSIDSYIVYIILKNYITTKFN